MFFIDNETKIIFYTMYKFPYEQPNDLKIPKVIIQTYNNKSKIQNKVYKNINKYASKYRYKILIVSNTIN
jgi:hypothetical protein